MKLTLNKHYAKTVDNCKSHLFTFEITLKLSDKIYGTRTQVNVQKAEKRH